MATVLGIETSCDETAVALVADREVRSSVVATQLDIHAKYGGVVPELASRAHLETLDGLVAEALACAGCQSQQIDAVAVTNTPGLIGALLIGVTAAKTLAWAWNKPLIGVNHIHAHACSAALTVEPDPWPAVALVVSGGHTSLYHLRDYHELTLLGCTTDDAAGEAFDKVASILGLGYPGGPVIDQRAQRGNPQAVKFPRALLGEDSLDFSFSGLKTAVLYHVHGRGKTSGGLARLNERDMDDICASFSEAVVDVLVEKTLRAARKTAVRTVVLGGGVAANSRLRAKLGARCDAEGLALHLPPMRHCTDNAAMVAFLGGRLMERGLRADWRLSASANVSG